VLMRTYLWLRLRDVWTLAGEVWVQRACLLRGVVLGRLEEGHQPIWEYDREAPWPSSICRRARLRCLRCGRVREVRL
jgi:hypothetical protein